MTSPVLPHNPFVSQPIVCRGHSHFVESVAFSPSDRILASASYDKTIRLWNGESGAEITTLKNKSYIRCVAFSPDGTILASGSSGEGIKLWDVESMAEIATFKGDESTFSLAFSPDGACLASGSGSGAVCLWSIKSRNNTSILREHSEEVLGLEFSPDGTRIASGSKDGTTRLWDAVSGKTIAILNANGGDVVSVTFLPSGDQLASTSWNNTIQIWDVATGSHIETLHGHSDSARSVACSPTGKYLASTSNDKTVRLWDVASRTQISTLKGQADIGNSVAFSHDGTRLAVGSSDNTVRIWTASSAETRDMRGVTFTSKLIESEQNTVSSASTSTLLDRDTTGPVSLERSAMNNQQDISTSPSTLVQLNNDITESVSLQGTTPIGFGGFGELFLGIHKDHGKVALKKPRRLPNEALIRRFLREVDLWCSVSHRYVLPCLGMCKVGLDVYVVSPFIEKGDLLSCMSRGEALNHSKLLFEVAEALTHLHHRGIVHGDVKAQNILLSDDGSALLCDFGLAKAFDTMVTSTESKGAGSLRWMPPELFMGESRSMASDVYSLGITIAEVLSGRTPYHDIQESVAVMFHVVSGDGRPAKEPSHSPEGKSYATLWETAEKCWVRDVKTRPHMAQVLGMLFPLTREIR